MNKFKYYIKEMTEPAIRKDVIMELLQTNENNIKASANDLSSFIDSIAAEYIYQVVGEIRDKTYFKKKQEFIEMIIKELGEKKDK